MEHEEKLVFLSHLKKNLLMYLFIFVRAEFSSLCEGFFQLWRVRAALHGGLQASGCGGFSCRKSLGSEVLGLRSRSPRVPEHRLSGCGMQA